MVIDMKNKTNDEILSEVIKEVEQTKPKPSDPTTTAPRPAEKPPVEQRNELTEKEMAEVDECVSSMVNTDPYWDKRDRVREVIKNADKGDEVSRDIAGIISSGMYQHDTRKMQSKKEGK